jgi:transcriptional regulator with XRE-family HTH domain
MLRRTRLHKVSADLITYLVERRHLTQSQIADMMGVDKSFVSRARRGERELSPNQIAEIADQLNVPMGAMLIDSHPPIKKSISKEKRELLDLCDRLMRRADAARAAIGAEQEHKPKRRKAG